MIILYKYEKESDLETQLANVRDWIKFLKEYECSKKALIIIITIKKKLNKQFQSK